MPYMNWSTFIIFLNGLKMVLSGIGPTNCVLDLLLFVQRPMSQPSKKWWPTILEKEISCSQWEGSTCTHDGPMFFLWGAWGGVGWVIIIIISLVNFSLGQKWWQIVLGIKVSCSQWEGSSCIHDGPWFFFSGG